MDEMNRSRVLDAISEMRKHAQGDLLHEIVLHQYELQVGSFGVDPVSLDGEERVMFMKDMTLAALDELHEALGEIGWKPWATSRHVNEEALRGELIDALHFLVNLMLAARMTPGDIYWRYVKKAKRNSERQAEGYDGVSDKCPICGRALDDPGVACTPDRCEATWS